MDHDIIISNKAELFANKLRPISSLVLMAHSILNWEKSYHAVLISSGITFGFMLLWLIDASVLSKLCIVSIVAVILDFALPILNGLVAKKNWTNKDEQIYQESCINVAKFVHHLGYIFQSYGALKQTNTKIYYVSLLTGLLFLAWLGSVIHNLLLTYLIVLFLSLFPGLSKQDSFKRWWLSLTTRIVSFLSPSATTTTNKDKPKFKKT